MNNTKLTLKIDSNSIRVSDLAKTLKSLEKNIQKQTGNMSAMCISEVRKGSMIFDLIQLANDVLPFLEFINALPEFITNLKKCKTTLLSSDKNQKKDLKVDHVETVQNMSNIVLNGGKNSSLTLQINGNIYNNCTINIDANEARDLKKETEKFLESQKNTTLQINNNDKIMKNVLIYFTQTNTQSDKADKAICEKISKKPIRIFIADKELKKKILENPYAYNFVVNLEVQYKEDKPILYVIQDCLDKFPNE